MRRRFGVEDAGNALADPQGEFTGQNILYVAQSVEDVAARSGRPVDEVMGVLARRRATLFDAREERPRPHLDDKVITAWNGLMIAAFARAARVLAASPRRGEWRTGGRSRRRGGARDALASGRAPTLPPVPRRRRRDRRVLRGLRVPRVGLIELFQATGDARWLDWAIELTDVQIELFFDERDGGWFSTTGDDPSVLLRLKEDYDGAEPSAASVTVRNLITLGHLTGDAALTARAERTLERYGTEIGRVVRVMPLMVANVALWRLPSAQVVLVGRKDRADFRALESAMASRLLPATVVIPVEPGESQLHVAARLPWLGAMQMRDDKATAYVCRDFVCREPVTDAEALGRALELDVTPRIIL